jgi:hypothetical protein
MKAFLLILLAVAVLIGIALFAADIISVDKQKLKETTDETMRETREAADGIVEKTKQGLEEARQELHEATKDEEATKGEDESIDEESASDTQEDVPPEPDSPEFEEVEDEPPVGEAPLRGEA